MIKNKYHLIWLIVMFLCLNSCVVVDNSKNNWLTIEEYPYFHISDFELVESYKIWDRGRHNAFTDIIKFNDYIYVTFREASCCHFSEDGVIRIIRSKNTNTWENVGSLVMEGRDLRDPKLSLCPSNTLCVNAAAREIVDKETGRSNFQTYTWASIDGLEWSEAQTSYKNNYWLWRYRWTQDQNRALGFSYRTGGDDGRYINLHSTQDGRNFYLEKYRIFHSGRPNETDLVFLNDSTVVSLVRRGMNERSVLGLSRGPFLDWEWMELNETIAGPNLMLLPDKRILAGVRFYEPERRTSIALLDPVERKIVEVLKLPSGGDTGYPGMIIHDGHLIISYYSSHESHTSIYLAKVKYE